MQKLGRSESDTDREIARLRKRNSKRSPVKEYVQTLEAKNRDVVSSPERRAAQTPQQRENSLQSPTRKKSPGVNSERRNSPNRMKSSGIKDEEVDWVYSPTRSQQVMNKPQQQGFGPTRSRSQGTSNERRSPMFSPVPSKSPGMNERRSQGSSPTRRKSPSTSIKRPKKLFSPIQSPEIIVESVQQTYSSPTGYYDAANPSYLDEVSEQASPEVSVSWETELQAERAEESLPKVGDSVDVSWIFDNLDFAFMPDVEKTNEESVAEMNEGEANGRESEAENGRQDKFKNVLTYNLVLWENNVEGSTPKKADEFIQRMCDQVRKDVEFLCGMGFVAYKAISYKVQIAGDTGILYYVKVNVWQNYCLHLRIYSDEKEPNSIPVLQAILERTQRDNGNIVFF